MKTERVDSIEWIVRRQDLYQLLTDVGAASRTSDIEPVYRQAVDAMRDVAPNRALEVRYEVVEDPPATVAKFVDPSTKEVVRQVPPDVALRIYRQMLEFTTRRMD